ncbi:MAG TPA: hypothetical protein PLD95_01015 [bacterium]|jgi:hypothetical protein|nr:hypothetical protein [bacterium]HOG38035.1 hypothetical protein [bacterium]
MKHKKTFLIFRIFFNLVLIGIFFVVLYNLIQKDLTLDGKLHTSSNLNKKNPFISVIFPEHRTVNHGNYYEINDEPVYFTVRSPIKFDNAELEIEFDPGNQEAIYIGYADNKEGWSYRVHTLYNITFDNIKWDKLSDEKNTLWQKNKDFNSIDEFYDQLHQLPGIAAHDFNIGEHFFIRDYKKSDKQIEITNCLRGEHKFYTYIKDEPLDFTFTVYDINRTEGSDHVFIKIFDNTEKIIYSKMLEDNDIKTDGANENPNYISIFIPNLKEGTYRIEFLSNDDNIIRNIKTSQSKISMIDRVYLCDNPEYAYKFFNLELKPTELYAVGNTISFYTAHKNGLQDVSINGKKLRISEQHKWYNFNNGSQMAKIYVPKNDIKISTRGIIALSKELYFNPEITNLKNYSESQDIKYFIAQYKIPEKTIDNWQKNKIYFDLEDAKIENGNLKFIISSPDLKFGNETIKIKNISIKLTSNEKITKKQAYKRLINPIYENFIKNYTELKNKILSIWHIK